MASKLERMVQPGERILFRSPPKYRQAGLLAAVGVGGAGLTALALGYASDDGWRAELGTGLLTGLSGLAGLVVGFGAEAVLTDMRLIYRSGPLSRTVEIPLWHIAELQQIKGFVTLRDRAGAATQLMHLADPEGLGRAILAETAVPGPAEADGPLKAWQENGFTTAVAAGVIVLSTVGLAAMAAVFLQVDRQSLLEGVRGLEQSDGLFAVLAVVVATGILAVTAVELVGGALLGAYGFAVAMRLRLSAAEARQVFDFAMQAQAPHPMQRLLRRPLGLARRFAARLYGEPI